MSSPSGTGSLTRTTPTTESGTNTPTNTPTSTTPTTSPTSTTPTTSPTSNTSQSSKTTPKDTGTPTNDNSSTNTQQSTVFTTTFITTDAGGQTIVTTSMGVTSLPDPNGNSNTTSVGPIVGGVVGGVGGILLLGLVAWLVFFRTKKPDRYEDGMFDPDKNIQRPGRGGGGAFDLGTDEIGAARVTPFVLGGGAAAGAAAGAGLGAAAARRQSQQPQHPQQPLYPEMRSYNGSDGTSDFFPNPYGNAPPSAYGGVGGANLRRGHTTSSNSSGGYPASLPGSGGQGGGGYHTDNTEQYLMSPTTTFSSPSTGAGHHPLPPLPPGASPSSGSHPASSGPSAIPGVSAARAAKEREAFSNTRNSQAITNANASPNPSVNRFSQHGPLVLTNPSLPSPEGEVPPPGVVVHRDGGRVREPEPVEHNETEIPPTYDSIPSDAR